MMMIQMIFHWKPIEEERRYYIQRRKLTECVFQKILYKLRKIKNIECLPNEILIDIFLLIPVEDLHNSVRLVCRSWWNTIQDPSFVERRLAYTKSNLIFQASDRHEDKKMTSMILLKIDRGSQVMPQKMVDQGSLDTAIILRKSFKCCTASPLIEASCRGLILVRFHNDLFVANLITRWASKLPTLALIFGLETVINDDVDNGKKVGFGFAYTHSTKEYKIACCVMDREMVFRCAIHTVCSDSLREVDIPSICKNLEIDCTPISVGDGTLHWLTDSNLKMDLESNEHFKSHVLSMEVNSEEFRITRDPPDGCINYRKSCLIELGESLSLFHYVTDRKTDVWVLEDYHKEVWVKKYCINPTDYLGRKSLRSASPVASLYNGEVVIYVDIRNGLYKYDLKLQEWKKEKPLKSLPRTSYNRRGIIFYPFAHINSLVTL